MKTMLYSNPLETIVDEAEESLKAFFDDGEVTEDIRELAKSIAIGLEANHLLSL